MRKQKDLIYNTEWDYLVILDACRYDIFKQVNWLSGDLEPVWTEGSETTSWFSNTFTEPIDTILISPHPFFSPMNPKKLSFVNFKDTHYVERGTRIRERGVVMGLAPPEYTTDEVLKLKPDKAIIHYCQPHFPALGEPKLIYGHSKLHQMVKNGEITQDYMKRAYRGNLEYVLREVERLMDNMDGKFIITADHGELFGEHGMYGHPVYYTAPELRVVPWFTVL